MFRVFLQNIKTVSRSIGVFSPTYLEHSDRPRTPILYYRVVNSKSGSLESHQGTKYISQIYTQSTYITIHKSNIYNTYCTYIYQFQYPLSPHNQYVFLPTHFAQQTAIFLYVQPNYISKFCEVETDKHSYIHSYSILMKPKKFLKRKQKRFSPGVRCLKGTASRDFYPLISGLTRPSEPLIGMLNNFRIRIRTERLNFLTLVTVQQYSPIHFFI